MTWPAPTRADHAKFCATEGWEQVRDARGNTGTRPLTFELALPDGRILRTRVAHPLNLTGYGSQMWGHILRDQLDVDEAVFWACVREKQIPDRGLRGRPAEMLPSELVALLETRVGLPDAEVAAMSKEQAIERLNQFWGTGA